MNIKSTFQKVYANRKRQIKQNTRVADCNKEILDVLCSNYQETINFLQIATMEETAIAIEVLCPLIKHFKSKEIVEIFKQKQIQYKKVDTICKVSYEGQIREAEKMLSDTENEKDSFLKEEFCKILEARETGKEEGIEMYTISFGYDHNRIKEILCRNYQETVSFLSTANKEEIAVAIEVLDNLVSYFNKEQTKAIINIFKQKGVEFSDIDEFCEFDYFESIEEAENLLEELE